MPRRGIPTYEQTARKTAESGEVTSGGGGRLTPVTSPMVMDTSNITIAEGLNKAVQMFDEAYMVEQNSAAELKYLEEKNKLLAEIDQSWGDYNIEEHLEHFQQRHDEIDERVLDSIKDGRVSKLWGQKLNKYRLDMEPSVRKVGRDRQAHKTKASLLAQIDAGRKLGILATNPNEVGTAIGNIESAYETMVATQVMSPDEAYAAKVNAIDSMIMERIIRTADDTPLAAYESIFITKQHELIHALSADKQDDARRYVKDKYNTYINQKDKLETKAEKERKNRWRVGDTALTLKLVQGQLTTKDLEQALGRDSISAATARTLLNALEEDKDVEDDVETVKTINRLIATGSVGAQDTIEKAYQQGMIKPTTYLSKINSAMSNDAKNQRTRIYRYFDPSNIHHPVVKRKADTAQYEALNDFDALLSNTGGDTTKIQQLANGIIEKYGFTELSEIRTIDSETVKKNTERYEQEKIERLQRVFKDLHDGNISQKEAERRYKVIQTDIYNKIYGLEQ